MILSNLDYSNNFSNTYSVYYENMQSIGYHKFPLGLVQQSTPNALAEYSLNIFTSNLNSAYSSFQEDIKNYSSGELNFESNFKNSLQNLNKFVSSVGIESFNKINKMEANISIDEDGEIMLEWYGRKGARANLTFGTKGELFFVLIFHGKNSKLKFDAEKNSYNYIINTLEKLYKDKL